MSVNCTDMLGRSAIQIAVDNENTELVELLLGQDGVEIGDALLYAIREGVYKIVEVSHYDDDYDDDGGGGGDGVMMMMLLMIMIMMIMAVHVIFRMRQ